MRTKFPHDHKLRKKLVIQLSREGKSLSYIEILLGYRISESSMQHMLQEHSEIVDPEWIRLLNDDLYRERVVNELLSKYQLDHPALKVA